MRIRYTGPDARLLAFPGGGVHFEPGDELDIEAALDEASIGRHHLEIVILGLAGQPHWTVLAGDVPLERPADTASKAKWVAYARFQGWTESDAKALAKADLIDAIDNPPEPDVDDDELTDPAAEPGQE